MNWCWNYRCYKLVSFYNGYKINIENHNLNRFFPKPIWYSSINKISFVKIGIVMYYTTLILVITTALIILHFVPWYPTLGAFMNFFKLISIYYVIVRTCINFLILHTYWTRYLFHLIVTFWHVLLWKYTLHYLKQWCETFVTLSIYGHHVNQT